MKDYRLYLFDFDNTLYDTNEGIREILRHALPLVGVEYNDSRFGEFSGLSMDQVFERYVGDWSLYDRYRDEFMRIVRSDVYMTGFPFPETKKVLRELCSRGKRIGIVSGKMSFKIENLMRRDGMLDLVETIVGYGDTKRHKPFPDPIELAYPGSTFQGRRSSTSVTVQTIPGPPSTPGSNAPSSTGTTD